PPAVSAQSGRDGSVLGAYRAAGRLAVGGGVGPFGAMTRGYVVGDAATFDVYGTGVPVFFVTFRYGKRCWLDALSGERGERLWHADLDPAWYDGVYTCAPAPGAGDLDIQRLTVATGKRGDRAVVSVVAVGTLVEFDARTGERLGEPLLLDQPRSGSAGADSGVTFGGESRLGAVVNSQFIDLDGDGVPEL